MIDRRVPATVTQQLLRPHGIDRAEAITPGMSGARIFRCRNQRMMQCALRRWPAGTTAIRVGEVHRVISLARHHGCDLVPRLFPVNPSEKNPDPPVDGDHAAIPTGTTFLADGQGDLWDLSQWMPGIPLKVDATIEQIRRGAIAIAKFHQATAAIGVTHRVPPAVSARLRCRDELDRQLPSILRETAIAAPHRSIAESLLAAIELLQSSWATASRQILRSLSRYESVAMPIQYVLRDIHRQHLLFQPEASMGLMDGIADVSPTPLAWAAGLIDFDAVRADTPMTDLARWVGSFDAERSAGSWEAALAGYWEHSPSAQVGSLSTAVRLAEDLAFATKWISLANWVIWIGVEKRTFPVAATKVANRVAELIRFCKSGDLGELR